jgi:hypothetical protein
MMSLVRRYARLPLHVSVPVRLSVGHRTVIEAALVVVLAGILRVPPVIGASFPLNDGGMFLAMIEELRKSNYMLPDVTTYNASRIPFAYPPLGLFATSLLSTTLHVPLLDMFRFLPLSVSLLTVVAFYFLCLSMFSDRRQAVIASILFATLPLSYTWQLMGGGVTRSFGSLFAVLALRSAYELFAKSRWREGLWLTTWLTLTILSHPENALFVILSIVYFSLMLRKTRAAIGSVLLVGIGAVILSAPWWGTVVILHGFSPFLALAQLGTSSSTGLVQLLTLRLTGEPLYPMLASLAVLGTIVCLGRRSYFLPGWLLLIFVVQQRAPDQRAVIPLALLATIGIVETILPLLTQPRTHADNPPSFPIGRLSKVVLSIAIMYAVLSSAIASQTVLRALSEDQREAMAWVRQATPANARFIVLTGDYWASDRAAEWFPVLAGRKSLNTVQGSEWLPAGEFAAHLDRNTSLQKCATMHFTCVDEWATRNDVEFDYIYVPKTTPLDQTSFDACCNSIRRSLHESRFYLVMYDGSGALVVKRDLQAIAS